MWTEKKSFEFFYLLRIMDDFFLWLILVVGVCCRYLTGLNGGVGGCGGPMISVQANNNINPPSGMR